MPHTNLDVIYLYTKDQLKDVCDSWVELNTKLAALAAISGLFLKFAYDINTSVIKFAICGTVLGTAIICGIGYWSRATGSIISPKYLLDNFYYASDEEFKLQIISNWDFTIKSMNKALDFKALCVKLAIISLFVCFLLFAIASINT